MNQLLILFFVVFYVNSKWITMKQDSDCNITPDASWTYTKTDVCHPFYPLGGIESAYVEIIEETADYVVLNITLYSDLGCATIAEFHEETLFLNGSCSDCEYVSGSYKCRLSGVSDDYPAPPTNLVDDCYMYFAKYASTSKPYCNGVDLYRVSYVAQGVGASPSCYEMDYDYTTVYPDFVECEKAGNGYQLSRFNLAVDPSGDFSLEYDFNYGDLVNDTSYTIIFNDDACDVNDYSIIVAEEYVDDGSHQQCLSQGPQTIFFEAGNKADVLKISSEIRECDHAPEDPAFYSIFCARRVPVGINVDLKLGFMSGTLNQCTGDCKKSDKRYFLIDYDKCYLTKDIMDGNDAAFKFEWVNTTNARRYTYENLTMCNDGLEYESGVMEIFKVTDFGYITEVSSSTKVSVVQIPPHCNMFQIGSKEGCYYHGKCIGLNLCDCESGWKGNDLCSTYTCDGNECDVHGRCTANNTCTCDDTWGGAKCNVQTGERRDHPGWRTAVVVIAIATGTIGLFVVVVISVIVGMVSVKRKKKLKLLKEDTSLGERRFSLLDKEDIESIKLADAERKKLKEEAKKDLPVDEPKKVEEVKKQEVVVEKVDEKV